MIGDTLNEENLLAIYNAMNKIKEIDRSQYFNQYLEEIKRRLNEINRAKELSNM